MSKSLVTFFITALLSLPAAAESTSTTTSKNVLPEVSRAPWSAGLVSLNLGSRFFWGASVLRNFTSPWAVGLKGGTALDFSQNQSFFSGLARWRDSDHFFIESSLTAISGFSSGSQLFGLAAGTQLSVTRNWKAEVVVGYEGIDRLVLRSPFSSWSTARLQVGIVRDL